MEKRITVHAGALAPGRGERDRGGSRRGGLCFPSLKTQHKSDPLTIVVTPPPTRTPRTLYAFPKRSHQFNSHSPPLSRCPAQPPAPPILYELRLSSTDPK